MHRRLAIALCVFAGLSFSISGVSRAASKPATRAATPSPAQMQEIQAATEPEDLVDLARRFFLLRQEEASRFCIEKACLADPSLLTDSKLVSPRSWRKFWYRYRAVIRSRKLAAGDAGARVAIARWLNEGGERGEARRMLRAALEVNPNLEAARSLAKTWKLDSGGPFRFDLTFGLTHPLFLDSVTDEGEKIELRPGRQFLLLPFAYDPAEGPLRILKYSVQATVDGSQRCRSAGIVLLTADPSAYRSAAGAAGPDVSPLRLENQPLWERIQVERKEDGSLDLVASNIVRPPGKRAAGRSRSTGDHRYTAPQENWPILTQTPSGYAAFLLDVPESMTTIEAVYEDDVRVQVETRFLEILGRPITGMNPQDQTEFVNVLAEKALGSNSLEASAAVAKLSLIRRTLAPSAPGSADDRSDPVLALIDQTLWSALGHSDVMVRRNAFRAIVEGDRPLGPILLTALRDPAQQKQTEVALDQIEQLLTSPPTNQPFNGQLPPRTTESPQVPGQIKLAGLEPSPAPANVFRVLAACLMGMQPAIVQRVIDIVLADGSEQAVLTLLDLPQDGRILLADHLPKVTDPDLKAALVRVLLLRPDPTVVAKALDACRDLKLQISGPDDPLLRAFRIRLPAQVQIELVNMLARSDLTALSGSDILDSVLTSLALDAQRNSAMQAALLQLARSAFQEAYTAPLGSARRSTSADARSSPFAALLARIATTPNADLQTVRVASTALLAAGNVRDLQEKLRQMPSASERAKVITAVGASQELWTREALPTFLAGCLSDPDPKVQTAALNSLADVYKASDTKDRWRLNLAVKLGLETQMLMQCTQSQDDKLARLAKSLLRQLTQMPQADSDHFESLADESARRQFMSDLERSRSEKPAGKYACAVYLDLKPVAPPRDLSRNPPPSGSAADREQTIYSVPLPASVVTLQLEGDKVTHVLAEGRYVGMPDERGSLMPSAGQMRVDAAPLILEGLRAAAVQKQSFALKVDRLALSDRLRCDLRHVRMGTWSGEVTIGQPRTPDPIATFQVVGAIVFLEPMDVQLPVPRPADVMPK